MLQHFNVTRTARFATWGEYTEKTTQIWVVIHGYGQLAEYFIRKFHFLNPETHFVIAPEALSRHYLKGFEGKVGAVWMTREDREAEISDYLGYLNGLFSHLSQKYHFETNKNLGYNLLAFSQGCSTAWRWIAQAKENLGVSFQKYVMNAGDFPKDVDFKTFYQKNLDTKLYYLYGKQDELIPQINFEQSLELYKDFLTKILPFEGIHELYIPFLKEIME